MSRPNTEIKKEAEVKLEALRRKRKQIIADFKKKVEEAKIKQIRDSI